VRDEGPRHDVVVAEAADIALLAGERLLGDLDHDLVPALRQVSPAFLDRSFDPGNSVSAPHTYSVTAFAYRPNRIAEAPVSWSEFYAAMPAHVGDGVSWLPGAVRNVGLALAAIDQPLDTSDTGSLDSAHAVLRRARLAVDLITTRFSRPFARGDLSLSVGTNHELAALRRDLRSGEAVFVLPQGRSELAIRSWAITAASAHPLAAHAWIDHSLRPSTIAASWTTPDRSYPCPAALDLIDPALARDPLVAVDPDVVAGYEAPVPSPEGMLERAAIWEAVSAT
jgi:spermidine/putrescine transport system substrate-binding protein